MIQATKAPPNATPSFCVHAGAQLHGLKLLCRMHGQGTLSCCLRSSCYMVFEAFHLTPPDMHLWVQVVVALRLRANYPSISDDHLNALGKRMRTCGESLESGGLLNGPIGGGMRDFSLSILLCCQIDSHNRGRWILPASKSFHRSSVPNCWAGLARGHLTRLPTEYLMPISAGADVFVSLDC